MIALNTPVYYGTELITVIKYYSAGLWGEKVQVKERISDNNGGD